MAHRRYAHAIVTNTDISFDKWMDETRAQNEGVVSKNHVNRVAKVILRKADPNKYLLSHATIVASVDTYAPKGAKLGKRMNRGAQIDVRYLDYAVKHQSQKFINNNKDCWSRPQLLSTYRTFVGAPNYCFLPETLVLMSDGTQRNIEDVSVGDEVISHTGVARKVVYKHVRDYEGEIKRVHVGDREKPISCTPNHPFFVIDRGFKKIHAEDLKCGAILFGPVSVCSKSLSDVNEFFGNNQVTFVNKIETYFYSGKVFNLEVEEDHSYIAEGVAVANCEHIQLPELSKGFIVDAVARDLEETVYIDILVATDKKHRKLVEDILSEKMNSFSMGCHKAGTRVMMADGTVIPIEDIRPEMQVLSQKGNPCRVDNLQIRENRWSIRKIKAVGLPEIESTDNHKYYVVPRGDLEFKKKSILIQKPYNLEHLEAGKIEVGDVVATPIPGALVDPDVSLAEARLLGLWIGDGWKFELKNGRKSKSFGIGICADASDTEISSDIEKLVNEFLLSHGDETRVKGGTIPRVVRIKQLRNASYFTATSKFAWDFVSNHVSGRRALTKTISSDVMSWPEEHQLALLSGIIDSDGCVSTTKNGTSQVFISTRNENLANQYSILLARCGIISITSCVKRQGTKMLPGASGFDYQIRIRNDQVKKIPSIKIKRFSDKIAYTPGNSDRWIAGGYTYSRVKKIECSEYEGFVYDLQVDNDHSYVANGIGVSNCISQFTICTRCGNVAYDDSQSCPCVLYEKGMFFVDENGKQCSVSELMGHVSSPGSNQFIEASWVGNPAFSGAIRRNFLNSDTIATSMKLSSSGKIYEIRKDLILPDGVKRAAALKFAQGQEEQKSQSVPDPDPDTDSDVEESGQGEDSGSSDKKSNDFDFSSLSGGSSDGDESQGEQGGQGEKKPDSTEEMLQRAQSLLLENLVKNLETKLSPKPEDVKTVSSPDWQSSNGNDNVVRSSREFAKKLRRAFTSKKLIAWALRAHDIVHVGGLAAVRANRMTSRDLLVLSWIEDRVNGRSHPSNLYKVAMAVGSPSFYPSRKSFVAACAVRLGRTLTAKEQKFFDQKGKIASLVEF